MEDEERPGQPKKFQDEELEALLDEDYCQTQEELAESLGVTQLAISKRLKDRNMRPDTRQQFSIMTTLGPMLLFRLRTIWRTVDGKFYPTRLHSPDLALSDYHLFWSMRNALTGIRFTSEQGIKNWLDSFLAAKPAQFFWDGIYKLPERWKKVIASDGQYCELL